MKLVTSWSQIEKNLMKLEEYKRSSDQEEIEFYTNLIKRGICFVVYESRGTLYFGPSRFVGYADNDMHSHLANESKDGRETNPAINNIIDSAPEEDDILEEEYKRLCESLGFEPKATGPFRLKRKYWHKVAV